LVVQEPETIGRPPWHGNRKLGRYTETSKQSMRELRLLIACLHRRKVWNPPARPPGWRLFPFDGGRAQT
jgi:hypothetical protein